LYHHYLLTLFVMSFHNFAIMNQSSHWKIWHCSNKLRFDNQRRENEAFYTIYVVLVLVTYSAGERLQNNFTMIRKNTIQYNTKSNSCGIVFPWSLTISILSNCYKNPQTFDTIFKQSIDISISLILFSQWTKFTFLNLRDIAKTECLLRHKTVIATIVCIGI
jgi:hypothetical protein